MARPVRVLTVDDSATMRAVLAQELGRDAGIEVVGTAANPLAAREAIKALTPDVLTLDIHMPGMSGLEFLAKLMRLRPMPVVVVSTAVGGSSALAVEALSLGAYDCFLKPERGMDPAAYDPLRATVRAAARMPVLPRRAASAVPRADAPFAPGAAIVGIGASTGGVDALLELLAGYPRNCPPTVITQHMPAAFTRSFAERLDAHCAGRVREASNGAPLEAGTVYLAPGGRAHLEVLGRSARICRLREGPPVSGHRPSVDALFASLARLGPKAVGVILTGMGEDGAEGMRAMRAAGARTLGQDAATSLVYGMPRVAWEAGGVERQVPLHRMAEAILDLARAKASQQA